MGVSFVRELHAHLIFMNKIMAALQLADYYAKSNKLKESDRLVTAINEAWEEIREVHKQPQVGEKTAFEYKNKIEWCPSFVGFVAYVLMCEDGRTYTGYTSNFRNRMLAHFNGFGCRTTRFHKPSYILHHEEYDSKEAAIARERFLKSWQGKLWIKTANFLKTIKPNSI